MKLVHSDLTEALLDEKSKYTEWIIESSGLFSKYVVELKNLAAHSRDFSRELAASLN